MTTDAEAEVVVYWRPGCPFCSGLFRQLDKLGVEYTRTNIWDDSSAAAFVRSVANGNETVPTVSVGGKSLVNPRGADVVALLEAEA